MIRVLGLDPGTRVCGYGVIDFDVRTRRSRYVECGTLEPGAGSIEQRLAALGADALEVVREFRPAGAGVELAHVGINPGSALRLSEARGVLLEVLRREGVEAGQYQPSSIKLSVAGHGRADKRLVARVVMRTLSLARPPKLDASDALAIAICHALRTRWGQASPGATVST